MYGFNSFEVLYLAIFSWQGGGITSGIFTASAAANCRGT